MALRKFVEELINREVSGLKGKERAKKIAELRKKYSPLSYTFLTAFIYSIASEKEVSALGITVSGDAILLKERVEKFLRKIEEMARKDPELTAGIIKVLFYFRRRNPQLAKDFVIGLMYDLGYIHAIYEGFLKGRAPSAMISFLSKLLSIETTPSFLLSVEPILEKHQEYVGRTFASVISRLIVQDYEGAKRMFRRMLFILNAVKEGRFDLERSIEEFKKRAERGELYYGLDELHLLLPLELEFEIEPQRLIGESLEKKDLDWILRNIRVLTLIFEPSEICAVLLKKKGVIEEREAEAMQVLKLPYEFFMNHVLPLIDDHPEVAKFRVNNWRRIENALRRVDELEIPELFVEDVLLLAKAKYDVSKQIAKLKKIFLKNRLFFLLNHERIREILPEFFESIKSEFRKKVPGVFRPVYRFLTASLLALAPEEKWRAFAELIPKIRVLEEKGKVPEVWLLYSYVRSRRESIDFDELESFLKALFDWRKGGFDLIRYYFSQIGIEERVRELYDSLDLSRRERSNLFLLGPLGSLDFLIRKKLKGFGYKEWKPDWFISYVLSWSKILGKDLGVFAHRSKLKEALKCARKMKFLPEFMYVCIRISGNLEQLFTYLTEALEVEKIFKRVEKGKISGISTELFKNERFRILALFGLVRSLKENCLMEFSSPGEIPFISDPFFSFNTRFDELSKEITTFLLDSNYKFSIRNFPLDWACFNMFFELYRESGPLYESVSEKLFILKRDDALKVFVARFKEICGKDPREVVKEEIIRMVLPREIERVEKIATTFAELYSESKGFVKSLPHITTYSSLPTFDLVVGKLKEIFREGLERLKKEGISDVDLLDFLFSLDAQEIEKLTLEDLIKGIKSREEGLEIALSGLSEEEMEKLFSL